MNWCLSPLADHLIGHCRRIDKMMWRNREPDSAGIEADMMATSSVS